MILLFSILSSTTFTSNKIFKILFHKCNIWNRFLFYSKIQFTCRINCLRVQIGQMTLADILNNSIIIPDSIQAFPTTFPKPPKVINHPLNSSRLKDISNKSNKCASVSRCHILEFVHLCGEVLENLILHWLILHTQGSGRVAET